MHDKMHLNSSLPLEQLSTEELERLLRTPDGEEPDVDFIMKVMEVIQFREKQTPVTPQLDVDAAWQEFQEEYLNHIDSETNEKNHKVIEKESEHTIKPLHIIRRVAIIAVAVLLLAGTAAAFGRNIFQVIAQWTSETFHFSNYESAASSQAPMENDPYAELRKAVSEYMDDPVIPTWAPDGTEPHGDANVTERSTCVILKQAFKFKRGEFTIYLQIFDQPPKLEDGTYQKDSEEVQIEVIDGNSHYLFSNLDENGVAWISGNAKCFIQGNVTADDLVTMIYSIYKE